MANKLIHVCWIDRIARDLKLPEQCTKDDTPLVSIPKVDDRRPKRKCVDTFQSLKAKNIGKVSSL